MCNTNGQAFPKITIGTNPLAQEVQRRRTREHLPAMLKALGSFQHLKTKRGHQSNHNKHRKPEIKGRERTKAACGELGSRAIDGFPTTLGS